MSKISIQDLSDNIELDQEAMRAIMGGARSQREKLLLQAKQNRTSHSTLRLLQMARAKSLARS